MELVKEGQEGSRKGMVSSRFSAPTNTAHPRFTVVSDARPIREGPTKIPDRVRLLAEQHRRQGKTLRDVADALFRRGYKSSSGKPYGAESIKKMLSVMERYDSPWFVMMNNDKIGPFPTKEAANAIIPLLREARREAMDYYEESAQADLKMAEIIKKLSDAGLSQKQIGLVLLRLEGWVSFTNKLNSLPQYLLEHLQSGAVSKSTLLKAVDAFGEEPTDDAIRALAKTGVGFTQACFSRRAVFEQCEKKG